MARTLALQKKGADPTGAPDFTLPVSIIAQLIPQLDVNIAAQSIPTLNINIASISHGITVTTTVSNMPSTFPLPSDQLSQLQQITIQNIAAGLVFNVNVSQITATLNINNWPSTYPLPSSQVSTLQQITIQNVASGLYIPINIAQVSTALNISNFPSTYPLPDTQVSTLQQVTIQNVAAGLYIPINIAQAGATVNTNANISGVVAGVYVPITIHSVDSGVVFNIDITKVESGVTFNVNITGTPTINVQTSGGANIVIDKLTQSAYTERQSILANNGTTASMVTSNYTTKKGKFFPRGCRGFIRYIEVYCNNTDTVSHTLTVKASPSPGLGAVFTATISVSAGSSADWRSVWVNKPWNYDSLFIWIMSDSDSYGNVGVDTGTPYDYYYSTDEASWNFSTYRLWVRVSLSGETVGDLPVSGTVNTVEVPASSCRFDSATVAVQHNTWTSLLTVYGAGTLLQAKATFTTSTPPSATVAYAIRLYADGVLAYETNNLDLTQSDTATSGRSSQGEFYQAGSSTDLNLRVPVKFRRSLELRAYQLTGTTVDTVGRLAVNLIQ